MIKNGPIKQIVVKEFRGLQNLQLDGLSAFNLLVGFNNTGKTSLLEAIDYVCRPMDPIHLMALANRRELSFDNLDPVNTLPWLFHKCGPPFGSPGGHNFQICVDALLGDTTREATAKLTEMEYASYRGPVVRQPDETDLSNTHAFDDDYGPQPQSPPAEGMQVKKGLKLELFYKDRIRDAEQPVGFAKREHELVEGIPFSQKPHPLGPRIPCTFISPITHRIQSVQKQSITEAKLENFYGRIIEILRLFDSNIRGLEFWDSNGRSTLRVDHFTEGLVPLSTFGDGLRRVITLAAGLSSASGGVLLVDEIESAIHIEAFFDVYTWMTRVAKEFNVQIIATTHSIEAVDAVLAASIGESSSLVAFQLPDRGKWNAKVKRFGEDVLEGIRTEMRADIR